MSANMVELLIILLCTYKMGFSQLTLVDTQVRVSRLARICIYDSSTMPSFINANTNVTTIMIEEKASNLARRNRIWLNKFRRTWH